MRGLSGVFPVSGAPCRFLGNEEGLLVVDLNHPLSRYALQLTVHVRKVEAARVERGGPHAELPCSDSVFLVWGRR